MAPRLVKDRAALRQSRIAPERDALGVALMTTTELADYVRLNERTVLKLASQGQLPGVRLGNQWRFRKGVVDAWLDDQMLGVRPESPYEPSLAGETFRFEEGFRAEHVITDLSGTTMPSVLEELSAHAHALGLIRDKTWFLGALIERENVLSSAVGRGAAFPHTLKRHPEHVRKPFLLLGRTRCGVDFRAPDGEPVHLIVLMGLRYEALHLPWLKRLSDVLREDDTRVAIQLAASSQAICDVLRSRVLDAR